MWHSHNAVNDNTNERSPIVSNDEQTAYRVDAYLSLAALTLEHRRADVLALLAGYPPDEQVQIMLTGLSITNSFAARCADEQGIAPTDVPTWMRSLKYDNQGENE